MKRTNTLEYRQQVENHILNGIYDDEAENTPRGRAVHIWKMFDSTYNYEQNRRLFPNTQTRVREWLTGLPLNIAYANHEIIELAELWHDCELNEPQAEKIVENWFNHLAFHLVRIWERNGINPHA